MANNRNPYAGLRPGRGPWAASVGGFVICSNIAGQQS